MEPKTTPGKSFSNRENQPVNEKPTRLWRGEKLLALIGLLLVFFLGLYILPGIQDRNAESSKRRKVPDVDFPQDALEPNRGVNNFSGVESDSGETHRDEELSADTRRQINRRDLNLSTDDPETGAGTADTLPVEKGQTTWTLSAKKPEDDVAAPMGQNSNANLNQKPVEPSAPAIGDSQQPVDAPKFTLHFRFNSTEVLDLLGKRRDGLLDLVRQCKDPIEIVGHACNIGPSNINSAIGLLRAEAVADLLIKAGTDARRFIVRSEGEDRPIASNQLPAGRSQNRRVEILCSQHDIGAEGSNALY